MYIDLIVIVLIIIAVVFFFRRFSSFVYAVCGLDILFRLFHFLADNLHLKDVSNIIYKYIPASVASMVGRYTGTHGIIYLIVCWAMFVLYAILLFYIIRILIKRK
ncbi:MAG: hypothetical protein IKZ96_03155 [Bacilli bacterium]|nr:hypothetical protein [Bacilli bacterium]